MLNEETQVSLSLRGVDLDPEAIAASLGLEVEPDFCHRRGDPLEIDGETAVRQDGFCVFASTRAIPRTAPFEEHAAWLLDKLQANHTLLRQWQDAGWSIQLRITTLAHQRSGGPYVSAAIMRRMADLQVVCVWRTMFSV